MSSLAKEEVKIFADHVISGLNTEQVSRFLDQVEEEVRLTLYSEEYGWVADYVRLRFAAFKADLAHA